MSFSMIRRVILFLLFLAGFNFFEHFAHQKTDGFSLRRIRFQDNLEKHPIQIDPSLFTQPFHYLDCGNQCFAFASEDGKYILKFFKYANPPIPHFLTQIPLINHLKPLRPHRYEKALWKQKRDFQGYKLAYNHFKEETGLIAVHFNPSSLPIPITLTDKLHIAHKVDLSTTPFVLQKRATPIYQQLRTLAPAQKQQTLINLIKLLKNRISLNLKDDDAHFYSNFGFIDTTAIQIDPGHFIEGTYPDPELELKNILQPLIEWCKKNDESLIPLIENETLSY
jgi:hypothetical protein